MTSEIAHYRVFGDDPQSGNTAAVGPRSGRSADEMQAAAASPNATTSVFTEEHDHADVSALFFTAASPMSVCFHGLLACGWHIAGGVGNRPVTIRAGERVYEVERDGQTCLVHATEPTEERSPLADDQAMALLSLSRGERGDGPLSVVSIGSPKLIIPVRDATTLLTAPPALDRIATASRVHRFNGVYAYALVPGSQTIVARGFNPAYGVDEDSATGVAAGALCAALARRGGSGDRFDVHQGAALGQRNRIRVVVDGGVRVGGAVVRDEV